MSIQPTREAISSMPVQENSSISRAREIGSRLRRSAPFRRMPPAAPGRVAVPHASLGTRHFPMLTELSAITPRPTHRCIPCMPW